MTPLTVDRAAFRDIEPLRELYRGAMGCQIVHDSHPARGLADCFAIRDGGRLVGHACVGTGNRDARDEIVEVFLLEEHRRHTTPAFAALCAASSARTIRAQTNDPFLADLLFENAVDIRREYLLFRDAATTNLENPGGTFRRRTVADEGSIFTHHVEPVGESLIEVDGEIVATGGTFHHYNPPYADLYMETAEPHRRRGYAAYLLQEVKRIARETGHAPAARCRPDNHGSRAALEKAGMLPCGHFLSGTLRAVARPK